MLSTTPQTSKFLYQGHSHIDTITSKLQYRIEVCNVRLLMVCYINGLASQKDDNGFIGVCKGFFFICSSHLGAKNVYAWLGSPIRFMDLVHIKH